MAHGAYYAATRDAEMRAHEATIDALEAKLAEAEAHLDEARGRRAFYFSGEVRDELARLERANDALKGGGDVVEAPDDDTTAPAPSSSPRLAESTPTWSPKMEPRIMRLMQDVNPTSADVLAQ